MKLENLLASLENSAEALGVLKTHFMNSVMRQELLKPPRSTQIAPILLAHARNPVSAPLALEIFLECSSEANPLLDALVDANPLPGFA